MNPCQGNSMFSGFSPSLLPLGVHPLPSPTGSNGLKDRKKSESRDSSTGSSSAGTAHDSHYEVPSSFGPPPRTWNPVAQLQQTPTSGKKKQESMDHSSSSDSSPTTRRSKLIGKWFGKPPLKAGCWRSQQVSEFNIIGPCELLLVTIRPVSRLLENAMCSGVNLVLESQDARGKKQGSSLTLKVQGLSSGMVIKVNQVLSSMNFEAVSTSPICCDGSTGTLFVWRSKARPCLFL
uniref:Rep protein n=1 Tax=Cressdnaviricota sp. TaxID=2748378 RepID=A0A345MQ23_9VIRU